MAELTSGSGGGPSDESPSSSGNLDSIDVEEIRREVQRERERQRQRQPDGIDGGEPISGVDAPGDPRESPTGQQPVEGPGTGSTDGMGGGAAGVGTVPEVDPESLQDGTDDGASTPAGPGLDPGRGAESEPTEQPPGSGDGPVGVGTVPEARGDIGEPVGEGSGTDDLDTGTPGARGGAETTGVAQGEEIQPTELGERAAEVEQQVLASADFLDPEDVAVRVVDTPEGPAFEPMLTETGRREITQQRVRLEQRQTRRRRAAGRRQEAVREARAEALGGVTGRGGQRFRPLAEAMAEARGGITGRGDVPLPPERTSPLEPSELFDPSGARRASPAAQAASLAFETTAAGFGPIGLLGPLAVGGAGLTQREPARGALRSAENRLSSFADEFEEEFEISDEQGPMATAFDVADPLTVATGGPVGPLGPLAVGGAALIGSSGSPDGAADDVVRGSETGLDIHRGATERAVEDFARAPAGAVSSVQTGGDVITVLGGMDREERARAIQAAGETTHRLAPVVARETREFAEENPREAAEIAGSLVIGGAIGVGGPTLASRLNPVTVSRFDVPEVGGGSTAVREVGVDVPTRGTKPVVSARGFRPFVGRGRVQPDDVDFPRLGGRPDRAFEPKTGIQTRTFRATAEKKGGLPRERSLAVQRLLGRAEELETRGEFVVDTPEEALARARDLPEGTEDAVAQVLRETDAAVFGSAAARAQLRGVRQPRDIDIVTPDVEATKRGLSEATGIPVSELDDWKSPFDIKSAEKVPGRFTGGADIKFGGTSRAKLEFGGIRFNPVEEELFRKAGASGFFRGRRAAGTDEFDVGPQERAVDPERTDVREKDVDDAIALAEELDVDPRVHEQFALAFGRIDPEDVAPETAESVVGQFLREERGQADFGLGGRSRGGVELPSRPVSAGLDRDVDVPTIGPRRRGDLDERSPVSPRPRRGGDDDIPTVISPPPSPVAAVDRSPVGVPLPDGRSPDVLSVPPGDGSPIGAPMGGDDSPPGFGPGPGGDPSLGGFPSPGGEPGGPAGSGPVFGGPGTPGGFDSPAPRESDFDLPEPDEEEFDVGVEVSEQQYVVPFAAPEDVIGLEEPDGGGDPFDFGF